MFDLNRKILDLRRVTLYIACYHSVSQRYSHKDITPGEEALQREPAYRL